MPAPPGVQGMAGGQPQAQNALFWCGICTDYDTCGGCTFCTPTWSYWPCIQLPAASQQGLETLKAQLQRQLAAIEEAERQAQQQQGQRRSEPSGDVDIDALERKLTEALEELKRLRAQRSSPEAG